MKCWSEDEMERYVMDSRCAEAASDDAIEHMRGCSRCRSLHDRFMQEETHWHALLYGMEPLPDSFTDDVMRRLQSVEMDFAGTSAEADGGLAGAALAEGIAGTAPPLAVREDGAASISAVSGEAPKLDRAAPRGKRYRIRSRLAFAAIFCLLAGVAATFASPTLADLARSLFTRETTDYGLLRAQELGLVHYPQVMVKDKGYTVRVDEAVADASRVVLALQLFGPGGKHDRDRLTFGRENQIRIKDEQGKVIGQMYDMGATTSFYYMVVFFKEPITADVITVEADITQLGNSMQNLPRKDGNWSFSFDIDLTEAKKQTRVSPIDQTFSYPAGMQVTLKRLTRTVQGVRLELDTRLSEEALVRSPGELWQKQGLRFHFEDEAGEEIHSVNSRKSPHMDSLQTSSAMPGDEPGLMHWSYTFRYLPPDEDYYLVPDAYFVAELDGSSIELEPAKLAGEPVWLESKGDRIEIKGSSLEEPQNGESGQGKKEVSLHVKGPLFNEFKENEWAVVDPVGREYRVEERGAISTVDGYLQLGGGQVDQDYFEFRVEGLQQLPERLTLIRKVVDRVYNYESDQGKDRLPIRERREGTQ
ncbi:DUF4179 domain-containing protein [Paenibacillus puerhi]|uniref:DUF4179 domain-containing protein n=1 Tax=Paenibacillus puerhi TaxID=2692622 RepID=UPI00135682D0|nr:DUF4179 domain-containing protein [Paenibacillus puerhi]